jgi:hypothetical protein
MPFLYSRSSATFSKETEENVLTMYGMTIYMKKENVCNDMSRIPSRDDENSSPAI